MGHRCPRPKRILEATALPVAALDLTVGIAGNHEPPLVEHAVVRIAEAEAVLARVDAASRALGQVVHVDVAPPRAAGHATPVPIPEADRALDRRGNGPAAALDAALGPEVADGRSAPAGRSGCVAELDRSSSGLDLGAATRGAFVEDHRAPQLGRLSVALARESVARHRIEGVAVGEQAIFVRGATGSLHGALEQRPRVGAQVKPDLERVRTGPYNARRLGGARFTPARAAGLGDASLEDAHRQLAGEREPTLFVVLTRDPRDLPHARVPESAVEQGLLDAGEPAERAPYAHALARRAHTHAEEATRRVIDVGEAAHDVEAPRVDTIREVSQVATEEALSEALVLEEAADRGDQLGRRELGSVDGTFAVHGASISRRSAASPAAALRVFAGSVDSKVAMVAKERGGAAASPQWCSGAGTTKIEQ